ncbi:hypothetical protein CBR_g38204 [Chara braunii]|uniref:Tyrosinase copper-binding domain-containing protein n=1 Tax=Chara braunii TaxID=69332 RepID=A0A388LPV2_CHABU|nr:hypothetical protein CBR_g38204 [Chara braunii]|eukprot:GBG84233.1 hypothetical protein CBR_g38204 [Chara braunii]
MACKDLGRSGQFSSVMKSNRWDSEPAGLRRTRWSQRSRSGISRPSSWHCGGLLLAFLAVAMISFYPTAVMGQSGALSAPDLASCQFSLRVGGQPCCLQKPTSTTPRYAFQANTSIPQGVRQSYQTAFSNSAYVRKYTEAYRKMKALDGDDPNDPRGMEQQRRVHCAYCSGGGAYGSNYEMHGNWFFLPWHRMMLYLHERILANLAGDPGFKIPFWNWDTSRGREIPREFRDRTTALHNSRRNTDDNDLRDRMEKGTTNRIMEVSVLEAETMDMFLGGPIGNGRPGALEYSSHGAVHMAVGEQNNPFQDMGNLGFAARDTLFYGHHANIDRLWSVWTGLLRTDGRPRRNPTSAAWLNSAFAFYDERKSIVSMRVSDTVDPAKSLRYSYENVKMEWLPSNNRFAAATSVLKPRPSPYLPSIPTDSQDVVRELDEGSDADEEGQERAEAAQVVPMEGEDNEDLPHEYVMLASSSPFSFRSNASLEFSLRLPSRPMSPRVKVEVLSFNGMGYERSERIAFHVFINQPQATIHTKREGNPHYAGSFFHTPISDSGTIERTVKYPVLYTLQRQKWSKKEVNVKLIPVLGDYASEQCHRRKQKRVVKFKSCSIEYVRYKRP